MEKEINRMNHKLKVLQTLRDRCDIGRVLNQLGMIGEVAEIGVDMGYYAKEVLRIWKGRVYYAVDLWDHQDPNVYDETNNFDHSISFQRASDTARKDTRMKMVKMASVDAAKLLPDACLDWVWIDANHDYNPVVDDMKAWWPKLKPGGIFSGHDYPLPGVTKAVNEWMTEHKMDFIHIDSSWWSVKP